MPAFTPCPLVPRAMFFTTGIGSHAWELRAHSLMYMAAGLGPTNRVYVSSRVPPQCELLERSEGVGLLQDGQIIFAVQAMAQTQIPGARIATAVGIAVPEDGGLGCVAEVLEDDALGKTGAQAAEKAVLMALAAMAIELGEHDYIPPSTWSPGSDETVRIGDRLIRTQAVSAEATGPDNGDWVKALAALVFLF